MNGMFYRQSLDGFGLVKAKLQVAIKLLACLLEVVLVEATYILPLVRIMAETLTVTGLDMLQAATAGEEGIAHKTLGVASLPVMRMSCLRHLKSAVSSQIG
jgi:hypothetical protein